MQKSYAVPTLVAKGEVVGATRDGKIGEGDPFFPHTAMAEAPGNVGYQL
jgi:hypothetical protein